MSVRVAFGGEEIIQEDTTGDEIFFLDSGIVQIFSKHCDFVVKALADGCYFGDVACLLGCKRTATIKARTNSNLYVLNRESLMTALTDLPGIRKKMMDTASGRRKRMLLLDESFAKTGFNEEDIEDEEDASTKYFVEMKAPSKKTLGSSTEYMKRPSSFNNLFSRISIASLHPSSNVIFKGKKPQDDTSNNPQEPATNCMDDVKREVGASRLSKRVSALRDMSLNRPLSVDTDPSDEDTFDPIFAPQNVGTPESVTFQRCRDLLIESDAEDSERDLDSSRGSDSSVYF